MTDAEIIAALKALAEKWTREGRAEQYGAIGSTKMECASEVMRVIKGQPRDDQKSPRAKQNKALPR